MARFKGTFSVAANYEPLVGGPFDARQLVETKSDLINPTTWRQANGDIWVYQGMIVAVASDTDSKNNGVYILKGSNYTLEESWERLSTESEITSLQQQIDNLEISSGGSIDIEVDTETDLPEIGDINTTYYVKQNSSILRWDEENNTYQSFGGSELEINLIHGGNANGNN